MMVNEGAKPKFAENSSEKYKIRLISPNCNQEQTVLEIVTALDNLDAITNEILSSVENRIQDEKLRMTNIASRINHASTKINQLKESKKGIRVISSSKFPEHDDSDGRRMLKGVPVLTLKPLPSQNEMVKNNHEIIAKIKSLRKFYDPPMKNIDEFLQFYHVRDKYEAALEGITSTTHGWTGMVVAGMGRPPDTLDNIDSFFVFNSLENAYRIPDKIGGGSLDDKLSKRGQVEDSTAASHNLSDLSDNNVPSQTAAISDFYYHPSSVQIPEIDVPDTLPDLPGVMDSFGDLTGSLGFSDDSSLLFPFQKPAATISLPSVTDNHDDTKLSSKPSTHASESSKNVTDTEPVSSPLPSKEAATSVSGIPMVSPVNIPVPPPPPPPPPPMPPVEEISKRQILNAEEKETISKPIQQNKTPVAGDLRSSLMAAIREAGGVGSGKLKSVKEKREEARRKKQEEKTGPVGLGSGAAPGVDMMADLKNTLAMRRKGISGINENTKAPDIGGIMHSISSKIPTLDNDDDDFMKSASSDEDAWN